MRFFKCLALLLVSLGLAACGQKQEASNVVSVGTISGPETQLMQVAQNVAAEKYGLHVKIVEFSDYNLPNQALADGSLDVNMFQHMPYLEASIAAHHYDIIPIAKTFIYPMGIYSNKIDRLSELKSNAVVAIPNDPTNEARALLLLQSARLITLKPNVTVTATPDDIATNPKNLKFEELDAASLPRTLPDVSIAVINSNYAIAAGLLPQVVQDKITNKDAIYIEGKDSLYANLFVVKADDKNNPKIQDLVNAFQSPQVLAAAQSIFHGDAIQAW